MCIKFTWSPRRAWWRVADKPGRTVKGALSSIPKASDLIGFRGSRTNMPVSCAAGELLRRSHEVAYGRACLDFAAMAETFVIYAAIYPLMSLV